MVSSRFCPSCRLKAKGFTDTRASECKFQVSAHRGEAQQRKFTSTQLTTRGAFLAFSSPDSLRFLVALLAEALTMVAGKRGEIISTLAVAARGNAVGKRDGAGGQAKQRKEGRRQVPFLSTLRRRRGPLAVLEKDAGLMRE
jgi:hypothetical protein